MVLCGTTHNGPQLDGQAHSAANTRFPSMTFVHPDPPVAMDSIIRSPEPDFRDFLTSITASGRDTWILGTWARLRRWGFPVRLANTFESGKLCVAHRDDVATRSRPWDCFVVSVRADRDRTFHCHLEVVQSPANLESRSCHYIPHWPMPDLHPRNPSRGNHVARVGYFGLERNLAARFRAPDFRDRLSERGVTLVIRDDPARWNDYSDIDLVLAVRDGTPDFLASKPATKLFNAWLAGCPALVGAEPAYRHHAVDDLSLLAVSSPEELLGAVDRYRGNPEAYACARRRCAELARTIDEESTVRAWVDFFEVSAGPAFASWASNASAWRSVKEVARAGVSGLRMRMRGNHRRRGYDFQGNPVRIHRSRLRRAALWLDRIWTASESRKADIPRSYYRAP